MTKRRVFQRWPELLLVLLHFGLYSHDLMRFPIFVDEVTHITWSRQTLLGHPFYAFHEGKYLMGSIFTVFWPFEAGGYVSRMVTVLAGTLALAALLGLGGLLFQRRVTRLAGALSIVLPMRYFFGRMAMSDPLALYGVMLLNWGVARLFARCTSTYPLAVGRGFWSRNHALLAGFSSLAMAASMLLRLTHVLFLAVPLLGWILFSANNRRNAWWLAVVYGGAFAILLPYGVLAWIAQDIGLGHSALFISGSTTAAERIAHNLQLSWSWLGSPYLGKTILIAGIIALGWGFWRRDRPILFIALPALLLYGTLTAILNLSFPRYYLQFTDLLLIGATSLLWALLDGIKPLSDGWRGMIAWLLAGLVALPMAGFLLTYHRDPAALPLPEKDQHDYIAFITSGFALTDAVTFVAGEASAARPVVVVCQPEVECDWFDVYLHGHAGLSYVRANLLSNEWVRDVQATGGRVFYIGNDPPWPSDYSLPATLSQTEVARFARPGGETSFVVIEMGLP